MAGLAENYRLVVYLSDVEGFSYRDSHHHGRDRDRHVASERGQAQLQIMTGFAADRGIGITFWA